MQTASATCRPPWDHSFLAKDQQELSAICSAAETADTPAAILELAIRFDASRLRKEKDLDVFYTSALNTLSTDTRRIIQELVLEFSASKKMAYATFDLQGFAREVPEAAKVILLNGCQNFSAQMLTYEPQTVKLGDL